MRKGRDENEHPMQKDAVERPRRTPGIPHPGHACKYEVYLSFFRSIPGRCRESITIPVIQVTISLLITQDAAFDDVHCKC
jgi:hypothetical protein